MTTSGNGPSSRMLPASTKGTFSLHALVHDPARQLPALDRLADAAQPADRVDRAEMVLVPLIGRKSLVERDAETRAVERLLDVVRRQGIAGEEHVDEAVANQLGNQFAPAGVDHGRSQDGEHLVARRTRLAHGRRDLANAHRLRPLARYRAGHELEQFVLAHLGFRRQHANAATPHDDAIPAFGRPSSARTGRAAARIRPRSRSPFPDLRHRSSRRRVAPACESSWSSRSRRGTRRPCRRKRFGNRPHVP